MGEPKTHKKIVQVLDCVHAFGPKPLFAGTMLIVRAQALPEEYAPVDLDDDADLKTLTGSELTRSWTRPMAVCLNMRIRTSLYFTA